MKENGSSRYNIEIGERPVYLVYSYLMGTITPLERRELDNWILSSDENEQLFDELTSEGNKEKTVDWYESNSEHRVEERIKKRIAFTPPQKRRTVSLNFISIAASFIIIASAALSLFLRQGKKQATQKNETVASADIQPGRNKAVLTLPAGKKIILDGSAPPSLKEGRIKISSGEISYSGQPSSDSGESLLTVPRGGQFKVVLPDGTSVWLDAESSLKYPAAFNGRERKVSLTGEGYFEVTKNKERPFIVESPAGTIKVLGTRFNVNSYGDEDEFQTTLVEGSVQLTKGNDQRMLKAGQQAKIKGESIVVENVDTKDFTSWKDGEFVFRDAPLSSVTRQLARWYDLDLEFGGSVDKHLNATVGRDVPLSKILYYLQETGEVHFKLEGRKLIVLN